MKTLNSTLKLITDANKKKLLHVFFLTNPISAVVSRLIIEKYKIQKNNIMVFSFRNTDCTIMNFSATKIRRKSLDVYFEKLFWICTSGNRISKKINNKNFILYTPWAFREAETLIEDKHCKGHIYIEEGDLSYKTINPFVHDKINLFNKFKKNWKNKFDDNNENEYFFRNDANGYIGIHKDVFPKIELNRKIIVNDFDKIIKYYKPKLKGIGYIGLTCAEGRLDSSKWKNMIKLIVNEMPLGGIIRLHPSFNSSTVIKNKIIKIVNEFSGMKIKLCPDDVIIELEMLHEKKTLIGPRSSLSNYAKIFGSNYKAINLYN